MKYQKLVEQIIEYCGGKENITKVWNCFSRLRMHVVDKDKVDLEKIKELEHVIGAQFGGGHFQVIIGSDVSEVTDLMRKELGMEKEEMVIEAKESVKKKNAFEIVMDTISGIFQPMLVAIVSAGLMKGILTILTLTHVLNDASDIYKVLYMISDAAFYFLPFLLAVSAARKFKTNEYLALVVAGCLMHPTLIGAATEGIANFNLFGISMPVANYSSSVLPIILSVLLLSFVYKYINKWVPNLLKFVLAPIITLVIVVPVALIVVAPLGTYVGAILAKFCVWLMGLSPLVYGLVIGALYPIIIVAGMHYAFFPILIENIATQGFDSLFFPMCVIGNVATAACVLGIAFASKDKKMKEISISSAVSAVFGIIEPALFGAVIPLKKTLYALAAGCSVAGAFAYAAEVKMFAFAAPSILALPLFVNPDGSMANFNFAVAAMVIGAVVTFIFTFAILKVKREKKG